MQMEKAPRTATGEAAAPGAPAAAEGEKDDPMKGLLESIKDEQKKP